MAKGTKAVLVPLVSVGVSRNNTIVYPTIGEPFEFTEAEVNDMDKLAKASGKKHYRAPKDETKKAGTGSSEGL